MKTPNTNDSTKIKPIIINPDPKDVKVPVDLIDDLKTDKIDPLTEGTVNLGYEERAPRKKELEEEEHNDREDK